MGNGIDFSTKCASFALVLCPLCEPYRLFGLSLDLVLLLISALLVGINNMKSRFKMDLPKGLLLFSLYAITVPVYFGLQSGYVIRPGGTFVTISVFIVCLAIIAPHLKCCIVEKYYKNVVVVVTVVFLLQIVMSVLGKPFSGLVPFLDLKYESSDMSSYIASQKSQSRFSSMFLEPSHFAQYILPMLAIYLGKCTDTKKLWSFTSVTLTFLLVLIRSGVGLILASIAWAIMFMRSHVSKNRKIIAVVLASVLAAVLIPLYLSSTYGSELLERSSEITYVEGVNNSGSKRLYNGYFAFSDMPTTLKITGVSSDGLEGALAKSTYSFLFDKSMFLNNIHILLIGYGYMGIILFSYFIFKLYGVINNKGKAILFLFVLLCFIEGFFFTGKMFFWVGLILCYRKQMLYKKKIGTVCN